MKKSILKKEVEPQVLLNWIVGIFLFMFCLSLVFDLAVTFTIKNNNPSDFFLYESNLLLVKHLEKGNSLFTSLPFFANLFVVAFTFFLLLAYNQSKNLLFAVLLGIMMIYLMVGITGHVIGGLSWWNNAG